ncbi:MAG: hypothetical protein APR62_11740 [Smithella sp. SDB]|nr:MAG: hypothetical protein APR62_11740 [Smithella sp. SDB]
MYYKQFCRIKKDSGFTLLEVIVTLLVAAILSTILVSFMGTSMEKSYNPIILARNGAIVNEIIENMYADYKYLMSSSPSTSVGMTTFISNIGTEGTSQSYYDALHPYNVICNHRISFPSGANATETSDAGSKILKVTIQYQNQSVTTLFTE